MAETKLLADSIRERIQASPLGAISFRDYMELCLYHPEHGYYMRDKSKIGREGDFYTSSAIGGLFGEILAAYMAKQLEQWEAVHPITLVEWGGGSGQLAQQILDELKLHCVSSYERLRYISVEASPHHRALQANKLAAHAERVTWLSEQEWLESGPREHVIVFSNELADAFPVHRVQIIEGQPHEIYVEWDDKGNSFRDKRVPVEDGRLLSYIRCILDRGIPLEEGQQLEVNLEAAAWLHRVAGSIRNGQLITIDYGDTAEELYAPHRMNGTLLCYRKHRAEDNPYADPGEQDITSHVNFTELIKQGEAAGLQLAQFVTQKQFLVENGLLHKLQDTASPDPFSPEARRNRSIRQLLLSDQMSELFKVLIQEKR